MYEYEDIEMADNTLEEESTPPVETVDQTKAFAARLKEEKAKAKAEAREELAREFGYGSYEEYLEAQTNNKLLDSGLDPESVRPVLQDIIKSDPAYIEAMKYKEEKEALEKELFATNSIKALNDKFGTNFTSVDDLDEDTIKDWNKGTPLEKAFAANNYDLLISNAVKNSNAVKDNGKSHMRTVVGSNSQVAQRDVSKDELAVAKAFGFSEKQFRDYVNRTNK